MAFWNYRVVRRATIIEEFFAIHEAHYDEDQRAVVPHDAVPHSISEGPVCVIGDTNDEVFSQLQLMAAACGKPVLDWSDFPSEKRG